MKDVLGIFEHLGYWELRPEDTERSAGEWRPTKEVNGRYGTRDETHVLTRKRKPTCKAMCRLVDRDGPVGPGQLVATARKSCLVD
jgi:hypothetical protein